MCSRGGGSACWLLHVMSILPCVFSQQPADVYTFAGETVSPSELECLLPPSPLSNASDSAVYTWNISVSNDGLSYSNPLQLTVYDSRCLDCDCSGNCQLKASNVCAICVLSCCHYGVIKHNNNNNKYSVLTIQH